MDRNDKAPDESHATACRRCGGEGHCRQVGSPHRTAHRQRSGSYPRFSHAMLDAILRADYKRVKFSVNIIAGPWRLWDQHQLVTSVSPCQRTPCMMAIRVAYITSGHTPGTPQRDHPPQDCSPHLPTRIGIPWPHPNGRAETFSHHTTAPRRERLRSVFPVWSPGMSTSRTVKLPPTSTPPGHVSADGTLWLRGRVHRRRA